VSAYRPLFEELAHPRLVGSPGHARARATLKRELEQRGLVVLEHQFAVQPPGRLGVPIYAGAALAWTSLLTALLVTLPARQACVGALVGAVIMAVAVRVARGPATSVSGVNLIGVRPRARIAVWLAAHYDTKGQPISMLVRIVAVMLSICGLVALLVIAAARGAGLDLPRTAVLLLTGPGMLGGLLLLGNRATDQSDGALDNASALVTVIDILDRLPPDLPVGVLFPDAEEYGLIGADALARERANLLADTVVLNFDGIDDRGPTRCVAHRPGALVTAVADALGAQRARYLPVVVDGWAFARAARECATVMRGDWRTTLIVHTPEDTAERLTLAGSDAVAAGVAGALTRALT